MDKIVWTPKSPQTSQMWQFMNHINTQHSLTLKTYPELHAWSVKEIELFWQSLADFFSVNFDTPASRILKSGPHMIDACWFVDATLNYAAHLLKGADDAFALIVINERGTRESWSYRQLRKAVSECAEGLRQAGVETGDRVVAVMPNSAYTVIAFLAAASIGAVWASCSSDFGVNAITDRLGQINPKILFITTEHQYHGKLHHDLDKIKALEAALPSLQTIVICPNGDTNRNVSIPKTMLWDDFIKPHATLSFTSLPFDHPLYILFSSGTTGKPKCIIHRTGGVLLQHLKELALHTDLSSKDNLCFYTTCGWMMWNWMVSVLALGATLTLYDGSPVYPNANILFEHIDKENITVFGTSAKFLSTVEKANVIPRNLNNLSQLRCILSTGSPLLPKHYDFVYDEIKPDVQLASISGGTDIVSCFALGNPLLPVYRGELQCIGLGMSVQIFDDEGRSITEKQGELVCTKPFPTMPLGFWNDLKKTKYHQAYFERYPNVWAHGDFAEMTQHGGLIIYGRSDTVLNPGGVRIGTAEIYRQVEKIPEVLDSVVIGQHFDDDVRIVLFVKLRNGLELHNDLRTVICQTIRAHASPRHVPSKILQVSDIPRTMSGKVVELAVRQVVHGQPVQNTESLANPEALEQFKNRKELNE